MHPLDHNPDSSSENNYRTPDPDLPEDDSDIDNTLMGTNQEFRNKVQAASGSDPQDPNKPDRITPSTFFKRLQLMLQEPLEAHLQVGVGLLASIVESHPDLIRKINEKDGPQVLVQAFVNYLNENFDHVCQELLSTNNKLKDDIDNFVHLYTVEIEMGSPQEMTTLYLAQLIHFAFHMLYYDYRPVNNVSLPEGTAEKSCILLTRSASIITGSQISKDMIHAHYLRITKRDLKEASSPISIFEGVIGDIKNNSSERVIIENGSIGGFRDFSPSRIMAVKDGLISPHEMGDMEECTTSLTSTCSVRMRELIDMMRQLHNN